MSPTIAYVTARRNSRFEEWFLPGLARQLQPGESVTVIKIDRFADEPSKYVWGPSQGGITVHVHPPKPCVWHGPHRLTQQDWFAASSFRNTALCICPTPYIAYVDDLSILHPEWWAAAKEAVNYPNTVTVGLYSKVRDLVVEDGVLTSYTQPASGVDRRLALLKGRTHDDCDHTWMFGCSLVAPVETLLDAGGWPEMADGLSFEDCLMSTVLGNRGVKFRFDRRLFTWEDEAAHHEEEPMIRRDKGVSPNDKSHAALAIARKTRYWENYFEGSTRGIRSYYQQHGRFPIVLNPQHDWYDSQPISEMTP